LRPPFGGNPLEFGDEIWRQKTRVLELSDGEEIMTLAFFVLTQYRRVTDGRTDGQTRCDRYYPRQYSAARVKIDKKLSTVCEQMGFFDSHGRVYKETAIIVAPKV